MISKSCIQAVVFFYIMHIRINSTNEYALIRVENII